VRDCTHIIRSDPIPYNATYNQFKQALISEPGECISCPSGATADSMPVFPALSITEYQGGLCGYGVPCASRRCGRVTKLPRMPAVGTSLRP
jgi:hypothetical protein